MSAAHPLRQVAASALLALAAGSAVAQTETQAQPQTQYVIEQLVVTVNAQADGSGERVDQIKSGDKVDVLDRQGDQAHVRLPSGQEGWVRSSYLSTTPPMRDQLKARTDELDKLRAEKTKLETELTNVRKAASAAGAQAASTATTATAASAANASAPSVSEPAPAAAPSADAARSNPPLFANQEVMPSRPSWFAAIGVSLLALIAGFALGWRVLDKRIRAKYGGLRIY